MSAALEARAEVAKLARLLGSAPEELDYLTKARPDDVRRFREQLTDALFDRDKARFGRLAAPSRILPAQLAATIAERALGPMLCARLSGLIEPDKAIDIAKRLPAPFLVEVAIEMDPRRAKDVIARVPAELVATVARELADRGETVTMGRFVGYLGDDALAAAIAGMDDFALLETAFVMEGKERLDRILKLLPPERLRAMVATAEQRGLWDETLDLLMLVSPQRRATLVQTALDTGVEGILPSLFAAVDSTGSWESGLRMLAELPPDSKQQLAAYASTLNGTERLRALKQAEALHLTKELGPIGEALKR